MMISFLSIVSRTVYNVERTNANQEGFRKRKDVLSICLGKIASKFPCGKYLAIDLASSARCGGISE